MFSRDRAVERSEHQTMDGLKASIHADGAIARSLPNWMLHAAVWRLTTPSNNSSHDGSGYRANRDLGIHQLRIALQQ